MAWFWQQNGKSSEDESQRIPVVEASPRRPSLSPPELPKRRGTASEQEADMTAYRQAMRKHFASIAAFERERRAALGITHYKWVAVDVHGVCDVAKRNGGKVFALNEPPPEGHVQEGLCNSPDWCRCFAKPIVPGFED